MAIPSTIEPAASAITEMLPLIQYRILSENNAPRITGIRIIKGALFFLKYQLINKIRNKEVMLSVSIVSFLNWAAFPAATATVPK